MVRALSTQRLFYRWLVATGQKGNAPAEPRRARRKPETHKSGLCGRGFLQGSPGKSRLRFELIKPNPTESYPIRLDRLDPTRTWLGGGCPAGQKSATRYLVAYFIKFGLVFLFAYIRFHSRLLLPLRSLSELTVWVEARHLCVRMVLRNEFRVPVWGLGGRFSGRVASLLLRSGATLDG